MKQELMSVSQGKLSCQANDDHASIMNPFPIQSSQTQDSYPF